VLKVPSRRMETGFILNHIHEGCGLDVNARC